MTNSEEILQELSDLEHMGSTEIFVTESFQDSWREISSQFRGEFQRVMLVSRSQDDLQEQLRVIRRIKTRATLGQKEMVLILMQVFISDVRKKYNTPQEQAAPSLARAKRA